MDLKIKFYTAEELKAIIETLTRNGYKIVCYKKDESVLILRVLEGMR